MARMTQLLSKLSIVLEGLENDMFNDGENKMYYNGVEFTRSEWRNLQNAVNQAKKIYENNNKSSIEFIKKHKDYNRIMRMINYYKKKPIKKEKDFVKLEKLQNKLEKCLDKIDKEREINTKIKLLKQQTAREKRRYELTGRGIEDEFR